MAGIRVEELEGGRIEVERLKMAAIGVGRDWGGGVKGWQGLRIEGLKDGRDWGGGVKGWQGLG